MRRNVRCDPRLVERLLLLRAFRLLTPPLLNVIRQRTARDRRREIVVLGQGDYSGMPVMSYTARCTRRNTNLSYRRAPVSGSIEGNACTLARTR